MGVAPLVINNLPVTQHNCKMHLFANFHLYIVPTFKLIMS